MQPDIRGRQTRELTLNRSCIDPEKRIVEVAISSESPVMRWFGEETLGHTAGEIDLSRMQDGAPVLCDHDPTDLVGVVESCSLGADRVLRGVLRFGQSERACEVFQDVQDGIRTKISVGYLIDQYETTKGKNGAPDRIRATRWTPLETSFVSIPADASVGVGRALNTPPAAQPVTTEVPMEPVSTPVAAPAAVTEARGLDTNTTLDLMARAERLGCVDIVRDALRNGADAQKVGILMLETLAARQVTLPAAPVVDMSPKEAREYSYARAIQNALARMEGYAFKAGLEEEVHETIVRSLPAGLASRGGLFLPLQTRAGLDSATSTAGAEFVNTKFGGELIDLLRNTAAVIKMGAQVMPGLTSPVAFPRQTSDATVNWVAENPGSDMARSAPGFGSITLAPKIMQGATMFSRSLLAQNTVSIENIVRKSLAVGHGLAIDRAAIHGSGANNQPTGIYKTTGVNTKAFGGVPTYDLLVDMETEVAIDNALLDSLGWMTSPGMRGKMKKVLVASAAGSEHLWTGGIEGELNGFKAIATNQVSATMSTLDATGSTQHGILFGNWSEVLIGFWGALEIILDPYTLKLQNMIDVASFQMGDVQIKHPASFCVSTGATLT